MPSIQGALSGTPYIGTRIDYYESGYSIENNTSTVHVDAYIISLNNGHGNSGVSKPFYVIVNGVQQEVQVPAWTISAGEVWHIGSFDFVVQHEENGAKTVAISSHYYSGTNLGTSNLSANLILTTLPRASSITCTDFYIESSTVININSASSNFRHTLRYTFGNLSETIVEKTALTSYGWNPDPTSFYAQIPNALYGIGTIFCDTYNGDAYLGTKSSSFTARVDKNKNIPQVELEIVDVNELTINLTGDSSKLVKYFSNVQATITATAKNSSTIKTYKVNNSEVQQVSTLNAIEIGEYVASTIDSRGIEGNSAKVTKTLVEYIKLAIKNCLIERESQISDQINMNMDGFYFDGSFGKSSNFLEIKVRFHEEGLEWSNWEYVTAKYIEGTIGGRSATYETKNTTVLKQNGTFSLSNYNLNELFNNTSFDYKKMYYFQISVKDSLISLEPIIVIKAGQPVVFYGKDFAHIYGDLEVDGKYCDLFPIGSIYMSVNNINPSAYFGGTWEAWGSGRVPVGVDDSQSEFNTSEKTGGHKNTQKHSHTGTTSKADKHTHNMGAVRQYIDGSGAHPWITDGTYGYANEGANVSYDGDHEHTLKIDNYGTGNSGNLQPYITCYMWKRVA